MARVSIGIVALVASLLAIMFPMAMVCLQLFVFDKKTYAGLMLGLVRNHIFLLALPALLSMTAIAVTIVDIVYQRRHVRSRILVVLFLNVAGTAFYWLRELRSSV